MHIVLIPGFWLDGDSWRSVAEPLRAAGHTVHAVTLPGLESVEADRSGIGLADHVDAVVRLIDELAGERVLLVGHSGGAAVAYAAIDARPDRVAEVVYVDAGPLGDGQSINTELPVVKGEIPLPSWEAFEPDDLVDLTDELREAFRARAIPQPARVASDPQRLSNDARAQVPTTIVCCEFPSAMLQHWVAAGEPMMAEVAAIDEVRYVDLPTGHWPQFTKPAELAAVIAEVADRHR
jgi:pimeloyl-ACP methyl ester carboxylesterase